MKQDAKEETDLEGLKESGSHQRQEVRSAPFRKQMTKMSNPVRLNNQRLYATTSITLQHKRESTSCQRTSIAIRLRLTQL